MKSILLALMAIGLVGCDGSLPQQSGIKEFKEIVVIERGIVCSRHYVMFKDVKTGRRIMAFDQGMIIMPEEKAEWSK